MKIGTSTFYGIISQSAVETVNELEKAGFGIIELMYEYNNFLTNEEITILKAKGLDFSMHCPFIGVMYAHLNIGFSVAQIKLIGKALEAAAKIGCSHFVMHGGSIPRTYMMLKSPKTREFLVDLFIERFGDLFKRYFRKGPRIVMENLPSETQIGGQPADIVRIQEAMPEVGFCLDIPHSEIMGQTDELLKKLHVDYVHVSDNSLKNDDHNVIGSGKIDFKRIISILRAEGFNGKVILENLSCEESRESFKNLKELVSALSP